jgi:hypothetical protein
MAYEEPGRVAGPQVREPQIAVILGNKPVKLIWALRRRIATSDFAGKIRRGGGRAGAQP